MTDAASNVRRARVAIICPVYNEAAAIPLFFARIRPVLDKLSARYDAWLAFINNSSSDQTLEALRQLRAQDGRVQVITLSANVGYQRSLETGLRTLEADVYVMIDVDCEDPPEMIAGFLDAYASGYDLVYGERVDRDEPRTLKAARRRFYRALRALSDDEVLLDMAEFALLSQEVRNAVIADPELVPVHSRFDRASGYRRLAIPYKRERRIAGETHYSVLGLIRFAVAGILSSSTWLLRITVYVLPFWLAALVAVTAAAVFTESRWPLPVMLLLSASYIGCTASFTAIYVGRAYKDGLRRPNAFIDSRRTFLDDELRVPRAQASGAETPQR